MHKRAQPVKLWYWGPFFRHEAPQAGRFRQFTQVGAEVLGTDEPSADAEVILLLNELLEDCQDVSVRLSSLGNPQTRAAYRDELRDWLRAREGELAEPVRARLDLNPLRAFDSDDPGTQAVMAEAPKLIDRLDDEDAAHFAEVRALLDGAGPGLRGRPGLVRGLDYYTRTVFEFESGALGAQAALGGGGRYDGLVELVGGPPTPGVGWAAGIERILLAQRELLALGGERRVRRGGQARAPQRTRSALVQELRDAGRRAEMEHTQRSLKGQLKQADRLGAHYTVILGDTTEVKDMRTGEQREVDRRAGGGAPGVKPPRPNAYRDAWAGDLRADRVGEEVRVAGWVHRRRDHGGLIFIDLRDRTGLLQLVFRPEEQPDAHAAAERLRGEHVLSARGELVRREEGTVNPNLPTGEVELNVRELEVLADSETPPFEIVEDDPVGEELRLRYRYLDLRREHMRDAIVLRHEVTRTMRERLGEEGFLEIETPMLTRSTPEGARDFLVPARLQPGSWYALPQSPQLFKQLLMVGGFERYFQIVRCFRDEAFRADRQPEFTQLDVEMSFVDEEDVMALVDPLLRDVLAVGGIELELPIERALLRRGTAALRHRPARPAGGPRDRRADRGLPRLGVQGLRERDRFGRRGPGSEGRAASSRAAASTP